MTSDLEQWCIYRITNLVNGHTYIGQHKYKKLDDKYLGSGKIISLAVKKYGKQNFKKEILYAEIRDQKTADDLETLEIANERSKGKAEYNIKDGGQHTFINISDDIRKTLSEAATVRNTNRHWFNDGKQEVFVYVKPDGFIEGRLPETEETYINKCKAQKGENNNFYGRHHSPETRKRLSESHKGHFSCYDEVRKKEIIEETKIRSSNSKWYWNEQTLQERFSTEDLTVLEGWKRGRLPYHLWNKHKVKSYKEKHSLEPWNKGCKTPDNDLQEQSFAERHRTGRLL